MPIQIVGTPPVKVTFSSSSIATILSGAICGPGRTSSAPAKSGDWAKPQAFAWNSGTTGRIRSRSVSAMPPAALSADSACR